MEYKGIDVSKWQGTIDWNKVKASGIDFAIIRCSYGKENNQVDPCFKANVQAAQAAGIKVGVYHYTYAVSVAEAKQEAALVLNTIKGYKLDYPVAFDIEDNSLTHLGSRTLTDITKAFCSTVESAGYYVSIYANLNWLQNYLIWDEIKRYDIWFAQWVDKPTDKFTYGIWQYASDGVVSGIQGRVDVDKSFKDYSSIIRQSGLNGHTGQAQPIPAPVTKQYHTVKSGDNMSVIAAKYNMKLGTLLALNPQVKAPKYLIYPGQSIRVK